MFGATLALRHMSLGPKRAELLLRMALYLVASFNSPTIADQYRQYLTKDHRLLVGCFLVIQ